MCLSSAKLFGAKTEVNFFVFIFFLRGGQRSIQPQDISNPIFLGNNFTYIHEIKKQSISEKNSFKMYTLSLSHLHALSLHLRACNLGRFVESTLHLDRVIVYDQTYRFVDKIHIFFLFSHTIKIILNKFLFQTIVSFFFFFFFIKFNNCTGAFMLHLFYSILLLSFLFFTITRLSLRFMESVQHIIELRAFRHFCGYEVIVTTDV